MEEQNGKSSVTLQASALVFVAASILGVTALLGSHMRFERRVVGVMQYSAAQRLGLFGPESVSGPFAPTRVWFARSKDGQFEFRSALPVFGVLPFDFVWNGKTKVDLVAVCKSLGPDACRLAATDDAASGHHEPR